MRCRSSLSSPPPSPSNLRRRRPPQHILDEILDLLPCINISDDEGHKKEHDDENDSSDCYCDQINETCGVTTANGMSSCGGSYRIEDVQEVKSAQQEVYILRLVCDRRSRRRRQPPKENMHKEFYNKNVDGINDNEWIDAIKLGHNRLILRIWKGGSRWWNLNRNENSSYLAKCEIMGYQIARRCFSDKKGFEALRMIPRVLHFSVSAPSTTEKLQEDQPPCCWAILEYVGPDEDGLLIRYLTTVPNDNNEDVVGGSRNNVDNIEVEDTSYLKEMIKTRTEFGFDEPHPRWGRVPVDQALRYARMVLHEVVLPLHRYSRRFRPLKQQQEGCDFTVSTVRTYSRMVQVYRQAWQDMTFKQSPKKDGKIEQQQRERKGCTAAPTSQFGRDLRVEECLRRLQRGLIILVQIINSHNEIIPALTPVLVHMDLQPQNLIFSRSKSRRRQQLVDGPDDEEKDSPLDHHYHHAEPAVFSVLDWEDAAWADPRFDLILLCRKVCANRDQANVLWSDYARSLATISEDNNGDHGNSNDKGCSTTTSTRHTPDCSTSKSLQQQLGPIEPWLQLETIHSITAMLMQTMDLLKGGRNPWETKQDLWGKLQREFSRLDGYDDERTILKSQQKCSLK